MLITGESGTGKELVARALHQSSVRAQQPFITVNCAAIPADLAESLLFGHVRGAFTGAAQDQAGYFELADGGTLFLDEVGDMPLGLQAKFLRVLEEGVIRPVGATQSRPVDVRLVAATNTDMLQKIEAGGFRADLYYRLARFTVEVPPLRQRPEDIPLLARHFLIHFAKEMATQTPQLLAQSIEALVHHSYPGNIRELKNIIERALLESRGADIDVGHLHLGTADHYLPTADPSSETEQMPTLEEMERRYICQVLGQVEWVVKGPKGAAVVLGLHEGTLRSRMRKLGIEKAK